MTSNNKTKNRALNMPGTPAVMVDVLRYVCDGSDEEVSDEDLTIEAKKIIAILRDRYKKLLKTEAVVIQTRDIENLIKSIKQK